MYYARGDVQTILAAVATNWGAGVIGTQNTSQLCMGCHDGTVSVLSMYKQPNLGGTPGVATLANYSALGLMISPNPGLVGTSMTDDHPVNFTYNAALATADGFLTSPVSANCVGAATPCAIPLFPSGVLTLHLDQDQSGTSAVVQVIKDYLDK